MVMLKILSYMPHNAATENKICINIYISISELFTTTIPKFWSRVWMDQWKQNCEKHFVELLRLQSFMQQQSI